MKKLDNKNKTYLNYSTEDGKNAQDILRDKITLKQKSVCGHCETENNEGLYCKSCGKSLDEVETSKKGKIINKKYSSVFHIITIYKNICFYYNILYRTYFLNYTRSGCYKWFIKKKKYI